MSKVNVNPNHYKIAGRERQGEDIVQERHRQKHATSRALERFHQRGVSLSPTRRAAPAPGPPTPGSPATPTAKGAPAGKRASTRSSRTARPAATATRKKTAAPSAASTTRQASDKRGKRPTAQKRSRSRHEVESMPATRPLAVGRRKKR